MGQITLFNHQDDVANFKAQKKRCFDTSDPGTGKTISTIHGFLRSELKHRMLVLAPLSILEASWARDVEKSSDLSYAIAHGSEAKRLRAFNSRAKVVIMNHDGVKWLAKNPHLFADFTHCAVDEFTAFKNRTAQRSKALGQIVNRIPYLFMLSGTPNSNGLQDMWYPAYLVDGGKRLGNNFFRYRSAVCHCRQTGYLPEHVEWVDRPEAILEVADKLKDITIRYKLEECISMPERVVHDMFIPMPPAVAKLVKDFEKNAALSIDGQHIDSINAASHVQKTLQLLSGAVYGSNTPEGKASFAIHDERYNLVTELILERDQCLVAYNWEHQLAGLLRKADAAGIKYGVINGSVPVKERLRIVDMFQAGELKVIYAHPQSAGHGLTLTRGTSTIWASPTAFAEYYTQFNARIYRNGQTKRTETIRIGYLDSREMIAYDHCDGKIANTRELLSLFLQFRG